MHLEGVVSKGQLLLFSKGVSSLIRACELNGACKLNGACLVLVIRGEHTRMSVLVKTRSHRAVTFHKYVTSMLVRPYH